MAHGSSQPGTTQGTELWGMRLPPHPPTHTHTPTPSVVTWATRHCSFALVNKINQRHHQPTPTLHRDRGHTGSPQPVDLPFSQPGEAGNRDLVHSLLPEGPGSFSVSPPRNSDVKMHPCAPQTRCLQDHGWDSSGKHRQQTNSRLVRRVLPVVFGFWKDSFCERRDRKPRRRDASLSAGVLSGMG